MIKYIKTKGIGVNLTTNGGLFNETKIQGLLEAGINSSDYITFSILGFSKEVHENVMRGISHDKVLRNVYKFIEMRKKLGINGPVIGIVFYAMPENEKEQKDFFEFWRSKVDHVQVVGKVSQSFANFKKMEELAKIPIRNRTCKNIWERMTIYWNGDVVLCCEDVGGATNVGNLKNESIKEIWNSKKLKGIRALHRNGKFSSIPLCKRCDE
jgi:radical SAM protein with 4Fe4S-binding SPASM domain